MESRRTDRGRHEDLGRWLMDIRRLPQVRSQKIERVRMALQDRTYETEFVLDQTVERMSRDVAWLP